MNEEIFEKFNEMHVRAFNAMVNTDRLAIVKLGQFVADVGKSVESYQYKFRGSERLTVEFLLHRWKLLETEIDHLTPKPQTSQELTFEEGFKKLFDRTVDGIKFADAKLADKLMPNTDRL